MKKKFFAILLMLSTTLLAQKNTIVTIDGRSFTSEEFEIIYFKNNSNLNDANEVKSPPDYMKMFIDFKLKVIEAENRGLDTLPSFIDELAGYRDELAKKYLTDVSITNSMVKEAYFRTVNFLKVSHILIQVGEDALPEDTLIAYNRIIEIRNMYLNKEKTFGELAKEFSNDPSAIENSGSLPYFSAFKMITPFENVAFSTKTGEVSMPFRSQFGYHILKAEDIKPSQGEMKVAHIMKRFTNNEEVPVEEDQIAKAFIDSTYNLLQNGADFGKLARKLSDDRFSAENDGAMRFISQDFIVTEFSDAAFLLKNDGDYSIPVRTKYGWHIIKRLEYRPVPSYEELEAELTNKVKDDPLRSKYCKLKFIETMQKEYGYTFYDDNYLKIQELVKSADSDSLTTLPENCKKIVLFKFAGKDYFADNYFQYLINSDTIHGYILKGNITSEIDDYIEKTITKYEDNKLENKYPEFRYLIKEYHDGILLFSIMETEVWNKAIEDSLGLTNYYEQNKSKYPFGEHFDGLLIKCDDEESKKVIEQLINEGITNPDSLMGIANKDGKNNKVTQGRWEKSANRHIDYLVWNGEKPQDLIENLVFVSGTIKESGIKTLDEARGLYISDYQTVIEKEWLKQLHDKYVIKVNDSLLRKVKSLEKKR